jgi:hypothetical protein
MVVGFATTYAISAHRLMMSNIIEKNTVFILPLSVLFYIWDNKNRLTMSNIKKQTIYIII